MIAPVGNELNDDEDAKDCDEPTLQPLHDRVVSQNPVRSSIRTALDDLLVNFRTATA